MKSHVSYIAAAALAASYLLVPGSQQTHAADAPEDQARTPTPIVFQAAGPTAASIQSMVDAFRTAIGGANNGNVPGSLPDGRREINWDGGGSTATSIVQSPFDGFLVTRGARFTTRGFGFAQAPADGLAATFNNATYATIFQAFSPTRLFTSLESNLTNARFFVPGGGEVPATVAAFGAVFTDVDQFGDKSDAATTLVFYGVYGDVIFQADVPASKGDGSLSFVGVLFDAAKIARVRLKSGNVAPGPNDSNRREVVMMDDFIFGEPQAIGVPGVPSATPDLD